jgi:hypothetical protein
VNWAAINSTTVQDYEVQVLGLRETRITRIGFRETSRWSEAWEARQAPNDRKPGFDRMPVGARRYLIDQPRRTHKVGNLVLATGGRQHARSF